MAAPNHGSSTAVTPDTLITIKISVNDVAKRLKLPLRDLGMNVLLDKLRHILDIKPDQHVVFERYSDSASGYITLDRNNPQVFKTLVRAAKAKLKLRLKATVTPAVPPELLEEKEAPEAEQPTASPKWSPSHAAESLAALPLPPALMQELHASTNQSAARDSTALDQRSVGSGIFQFREARASQQTLINDEAPVPRPFVAEKSVTLPQLPAPQQLKCLAQRSELAFRSREPAEATSNFGHWSVYCNACDESMTDAHYHCSICDGGDYDLCESCVASGKLCPGEGHWLIKRFIQDGKAIHSTTERISPRPRDSPVEPVVAPVVPEAPSAFDAKLKTPTEPLRTRTCNNCVVVLLEREFVTCTTCDDFDLCLRCNAADKHGHHPAHGFKPATDETVLTLVAETKLAPGRNVRHNAICDGCDHKIYGVRHKCLNCPDWDYCSECVKSAPITHRHHRFAALYEPIADQRSSIVRHHGIYCDGPLCTDRPNQSYIHGVRYKCAICNDTDFCAACEALPSNAHNRTHPLIKFKTPVRNVNVSTENEDVRGNVRVMGDRRVESMHAQMRAVSTDAARANIATQVHTVADIKPTEVKKDDAAPVLEAASSIVPTMAGPSRADLNAHFVRDSVADGTSFEPEVCFAQVWTVRNPGPYAWPAGCSVRFVGGDNMLNVDNNHPASVTTLAEAAESNVVGRAVGVGEEVAFKVVLKAPVRLGKAISYWRIKSPNGTPFGHRLWCDIDVQTKSASALREARATFERAASMRTPCVKALAPVYRGCAEMSQQVLSSHVVGSMNEEERRAIFRQRIAQVKAEIQKKRALNEDALEEVKLACRHMMDKKANEGEKVKKIIEEVSKNPEPETEPEAEEQPEQEEGEAENLEDSKMVFPTLDKESPTSSTYQSMHSSPAAGKPAYVENEDGEIERSASPAAAAAVPEPIVSSPLTAPQADDLDEDIEVLSAVGDESDDGFMTDEEYDILDASDQETVASP